MRNTTQQTRKYETMITQMKPADITAQQLGEQQRLKLMIGAKDFFSDDNGQTLTFKFPRCCKANYCKITLEADDTYTVRFIKIGRLNKKTWEVKVTQTGEFKGVYDDNLKDVFENFTRLYLSL